MTIIYVDKEGVPGVVDDTFQTLPKTYCRGEWTTHYDIERFMNAASVITLAAFNRMVDEQDELARGE